MSRPLWEKLQSLQCHFTWDFEIKDKVEVMHILTTLALRIKHTGYRNRGVYLAMRAYLQHLEGQDKEALGTLRDAEEALKEEHPSDFSRQVLVTYGNYAWVYYHLSNYEMVERYLGRIREICQSLASPQPYSAAIPEVEAQKGWSLLAGGFRNGEEARKCFQRALEGAEADEEFRAGLATSVYACWTHSWREDLREEAQSLLEQVLVSQPQNADVEVYLATALEQTDPERAKHLVDNVVRHSSNPEVLRLAAKFSQRQPLSWSISILKQAVALDPGYDLPHYDLGVCYLRVLERMRPENRGEVAAQAAESFKRSLEACPESVYSRLKLARAYGEKSPAYEEEIYLNLMEKLPTVSKRCQQAIYLHWGDFLHQQKGREQEALKAYMAGLRVPGDHPLEQKQLVGRLKDLARSFQRNAERDRAEEVYRFLEARRCLEPREERWAKGPRR
ncbi:interferon-induced protein with tetratricopeptide repeats 5-like [Pogona vitticeps]